MDLSRRKALALAGGAVVAAAGGSTLLFAATRTPDAALAPWGAASTYDDVRLHAFAHALLAPNPHNLQPWRIELTGTDGAVLRRDAGKGLPETDPLDRQIQIGFGCFLELARMAAAERGVGVTARAWPDGPGGPVAKISFGGPATPDPLFAAVMDRRSCKTPFDAAPLADDAASALAAHADILRDPARVAALRDLTWRAWLVEAHTPRTMRESAELMRFGRRAIEASPDGIDMGGPMLEGLWRAGLLTRESVMDPGSAGFAAAERMYGEMLAATPAYAVIVAGDTPGDRLEVGRRWLRLNLAATAAGVALHPVSQALQEFEEMAEIRAEAHRLLAPGGGTVQILGRIGYAPRPARTPRWPLEAKLA